MIFSDKTEMLSTAEAADRLGVGIARLYRYINDGKLQPKVNHGVVTLAQEQVDALFETMSKDRDTYVGALEALRDKVRLATEPKDHADDAGAEVGGLVNDLLRRAVQEGWECLTVRINFEHDSADIIYKQGADTPALAQLEVKLAQDIVSGLCQISALDETKPASRSAFTFSADDAQTRFHAARAKSTSMERVHLIRFEQDHPDFERIWSLTPAHREQLESAIAEPRGLYVLSSPRDLTGLFHLLSLARRLCPEQSAGMLLTRSTHTRGEGFLSELIYGEGEEQPTLEEAVKTVFALNAGLAVFEEITTLEEARAALEIASSGVATIAFAPGSSLAGALAAWRAWGMTAAPLARELRLGIERQGAGDGLRYRLLCNTEQLGAALAAPEQAAEALEQLMQ